MKNTVITVSYQYGSNGQGIAERLAEVLGLPFYGDEYFSSGRQDITISDGFGEYRLEQGRLLYALATGTEYECGMCDAVALPENEIRILHLTDTVRRLAEEGGCVIAADGCELVLGEAFRPIRVYVGADKEDRIRRIASREGTSISNAKKRVERMDKRKATRCTFYTGEKWDAPQRYAVCVNSSFWGVDGAVETIRNAIVQKDQI